MDAMKTRQSFPHFADDLLNRLSTGGAFVAGFTYLTAAFLLRVAIVPNLVPDEAEQLVYVQSLELGYEAKNPPLFSWLVWILTFPFGIGVMPVALVHAACLFVFYACLYAASRQVLEDKQLAALAALSPFALWFVGWDALLNYGHSVLLAACCAATLMLTVRISAAPRFRDYVLLGAVLGAGLLAKYNYLLFVLALFGSALIERGVRSRLFAWPFMLSVAIAIAIALPHGLWLLSHASALAANAKRALQPSDLPGTRDNVQASWRALHAAFSFALPFLPLFAIVFAPALLRRSNTTSQSSAQRRLILRALLLFLVLFTAIAALASLREPRPSYIFAIAWLPLPAFLLLAPERVSAGQKRAYVTILMALGLSSLIAMSVKGFFDPLFCTRCRRHVPYTVYADALRDAGFSGGTIYSVSRHGGGENLRLYFPDSRFISVKWQYRPPPMAGPLPCLIVWDATHEPDTPTWLRREQAGQAPLLPADQPVHTIVAPMHYSQRPGMALGYAIIPADRARCP